MEKTGFVHEDVEFFSKIDWPALREQKGAVGMAQGVASPEDKSKLEGVLNLLDALQDKAAEVLGEEEVFGKPPKFPVTVAVTVPAYCTVAVEAESQEEAERKVREDIGQHGWDSEFWQKVAFGPMWTEAEDLRVVEE